MPTPTSPRAEIFRGQQLLAKEGQEELAAFMDIEADMDQSYAIQVAKYIDMKGQSGTTAPSKKGGGPQTVWAENRHTMVVQAINNALPSIIDAADHKNWHIALVKMVTNRAMTENVHNQTLSFEDQLKVTVDKLYGNWKVLNNNTKVKVAFNRNQLDAAGVGQTQWDQSLLYMFLMAHKKYGGHISFVPRADTVKLMQTQKRLLGDIEAGIPYSKPAEQVFKPYEQTIYNKEGKYIPISKRAIEQQQSASYFATMRYQKQWDAIYQSILEGGEGNIFIARINDSDDPNLIRMVIATGNPNDPDKIRIIGDVYGVDIAGNAVPATFTQENAIVMMQSKQAWQHGNSQDDVIASLLDVPVIGGIWDGLDPITATIKAFEWGGMNIFGSGSLNVKTDGLQEGGDFGRDEFRWMYERFSKGAWEKKNGLTYNKEDAANGKYKNLMGYSRLSVNAYGGRFLTEITGGRVLYPGRVEMDLFYEPLWDEIVAFEKSKGREVTDSELYSIVQVVKSRLNGNPDFFASKSRGRDLFDAYVLNPYAEDLQKLFKIKSNAEVINDSLGNPLFDWMGRAITKLDEDERTLSKMFMGLKGNTKSKDSQNAKIINDSLLPNF